jgi:hypothetical protein
MAVQAPTVAPIVEAIVNYFDRDTERIAAFYVDAAPKLRGKHALVDAILDGIDDWLIVNRWLPRLEAKLHGVHEVVDPFTGERSLIDYDNAEWGEY